jgi:isopenicillin N synthase-like dioxygenase
MKTPLNPDISDPRVFLKLPKEEKQRLLLEQSQEVTAFYQPGHSHIEWTEDYLEDKDSEPLTQTR